MKNEGAKLRRNQRAAKLSRAVGTKAAMKFTGLRHIPSAAHWELYTGLRLKKRAAA
jgi:hypothetical protein